MKALIEFYALVPLLLLGLAATYKFGYFNALDALWILPLLNIQGFVYSILVTTLVFLLGIGIASLYCALLPFFSHSGLIFTIFIVPAVSSAIGGGLDHLLIILGNGIPFFFGFVYFLNLKEVFDGGEITRSFKLPSFLIFTFCGLVLMSTLGSTKAYKDRVDETFPVVKFNDKNSILNIEDTDDWRLLESSGNNLILINLNSRNGTGRYEFKVIEANKVASIY